MLTRQFGWDGLSARTARIEALLPGKPLQRDVRLFVNALLPRVLERGRHTDAQATRWTLEDAWRDALVLRCWSRFANQLTAAQAERIVLRADLPRLNGQRAQAFTPVEATEGWELERGGYRTEPLERCDSAARTELRETRVPPPASRSTPVQPAFSI
jgi:hypothetical protein